jgi:glycosyltransferase involved in cell wall biosynthesis
MQLLQVIPGLPMGGAERVVVTLARAAREAGHDVAVAAAPGPLARELEGEPFPLPLVNRRLLRLPAAAWSLRDAIRTFRPQLVHAHGPTMAAVTAIVSARGRQPRALVSMHGVPEEDYDRAALMLRVAGLPVVACGPGVAAALSERGLRVNTTIVNGIGPAPTPADRAVLEREFGVEPGRPILASVGRLVEQKNHTLAIEALALVPEAVLVIFGEGPLRSALERRAREVNVEDRVILAGLRADARAIIGAADLLVLPSQWEGLPLIALEALSAGTPLVATSVRGIRELLTHDDNCLLVPAGDAHALADALSKLLADRGLRERLSEAGRDLARSFSEEAMVARFLDLYERLARGPNENGQGHAREG